MTQSVIAVFRNSVLVAGLLMLQATAVSFVAAQQNEQITDQVAPHEQVAQQQTQATPAHVKLIQQAQQLESQNKFQDALTIWNQVGATLTESHGADSWQVKNAMQAADLAERQASFTEQQAGEAQQIRQLQKRASESLKAGNLDLLLQQMQQAEEKTATLFGADSHLVAQIKSQNAALLHHMGRLQEAWQVYRDALAIARKSFGPHHPDTELIYHKLGVMLQASGNSDRAIDYLKQSLSISKMIYGTGHAVYADRLTSIGVACQSLQQYEQALEYFLEGEKIQAKVLGAEHPRRAQTLKDIGVTYLSMQNATEAKRFLNAAAGVMEEKLGPENPTTILAKSQLATALAMDGQMDQAAQLLAQVLTGNRKVHGQDSAPTAKTEFQLGILMGKKGDYDNAGPLLKHALTVQSQAFGKEHRSTQRTAAAYASVLERTGHQAEAEQLRQSYTGTATAQNPNATGR